MILSNIVSLLFYGILGFLSVKICPSFFIIEIAITFLLSLMVHVIIRGIAGKRNYHNYVKPILIESYFGVIFFSIPWWIIKKVVNLLDIDHEYFELYQKTLSCLMALDTDFSAQEQTNLIRYCSQTYHVYFFSDETDEHNAFYKKVYSSDKLFTFNGSYIPLILAKLITIDYILGKYEYTSTDDAIYESDKSTFTYIVETLPFPDSSLISYVDLLNQPDARVAIFNRITEDYDLFVK